MSEVQNGEVHIDETDASGGSKEGVVRWVLLISLLAAILIMSIIWIAGAFSSSNDEAAYMPPPPLEETVATEDAGDGTDGVILPEDTGEEVVGGDLAQ